MDGGIIPDEAVARALPWDELVPALHSAFADDIVVPGRMHTATSSGTLLVMPAWRRHGLLGLKVATIHPGNNARGMPAVHATYILLREDSGQRVCVLDGRALTVRRTAATSALASRLLSRPDSRTLLMVGAGALAGPLIEAHLWARPVERVMVWNRTPERARRLVSSLSNRHDFLYGARATSRPVSFEVAGSLTHAVSEADVISCATLSTEPLIRDAQVRAGTHIDLVGAFRPDMRETDGAVLGRARVFVDARAGALSEAGDILQAIDEGFFTPDAIEGDLNALCRAPQAPGRAPSDITVFKSVGHALEDLAAAELVAAELGLYP
ncbi:MAG: ornithine cyclodeaminase [Bacteroidetes bacterium CG12_big_fil_rev_8_21_14_0_65_60_17]|nr:MAG: ornithine cyclodeaminase [Bacteroidetes bacterium CG12_big_fil_rev_8_21_14_0_65_60_17]